jgi:hypothetical protein
MVTALIEALNAKNHMLAHHAQPQEKDYEDHENC